jgi:Flp pilus assembly pilin Flp
MKLERFESRLVKLLAVRHSVESVSVRKSKMQAFLTELCSGEEGQDIAEYAVMVAVILIIVVGTVRLIGTNANTVFSNVASAVQ